MQQHITITTDFDVTQTGVVRNFKKEALPLSVGRLLITTEKDWILKRRQQSNWETMIQVISLRTLPINLRQSKKGKKWIINFDIEAGAVYQLGDDLIGLLKQDCTNVPLLTGLTETKKLGPFVIIEGTTKNMTFDTYEL